MNDLLVAAIPFDGFYNSVHDELIDDVLTRMCEDDHGDVPEGIMDRLFQAIDYQDIWIEYSKEFVQWYSKMIADQTDFNPAFEFELMQSPREYNFTTDRLFCYVAKGTVLHMAMNVDEAVLERTIKQNFTSRDGFSSFYDNSLYADDWFEVPLNEWDWNMLQTLLSAYLTQLDFEFDIYELYEYREEVECILYNHLGTEADAIIAEAYDINYGSLAS